MIIVDIKNLKIIDIEDIKKIFPHIMFPKNLFADSFKDTELEKLYIFIDEPEKPIIKNWEYLILSKPIKKGTKYFVNWLIKAKEFNEEIKLEYKSKIENSIKSKLDSNKVNYEDYEIKTWERQEAEARSYLENNSNSTPMLDALSESRLEEKKYLAEKIVSKADAAAIYIASLLGQKKKLLNQINTAKSFEDLPELI